MRKLFGTDGIRGIANESLTVVTAYNVGNALSSIKNKPLVVIGKDTRVSGDVLSCGLIAGVLSGGGNAIYLGTLPTPAIAFETKRNNADFGVVISASHNPAEYNGIKLFGGDGYKLPDEIEEEIESKMGLYLVANSVDSGRVVYRQNTTEEYEKYLAGSIKNNLNGLKIVFDGSNGAGFSIGPKVFKELGAIVVAKHCDENAIINDKCGCLFPEVLSNAVKENEADVGFAIDGDGDRLIACDNEGNIVDGDVILYIISTFLKEKNQLKNNIAVGTLHTNMGVEKALLAEGINFLRSDIGDRYVIELMKKKGSVVGGEQSGHIIIGDRSTTGDGILTALVLCDIVKETGKSLKELSKVVKFPQVNVNIKVEDKKLVMQSEELKNIISKIEKEVKKDGRILVRASGTEPKVRVMVEHFNKEEATRIANELSNKVNEISNMEK